jgi:hypothetical protein
VIDAAASNDRRKLDKAVVALGLIYVVGALATFARSWLFTLAGQSLVARVRRQVRFLSHDGFQTSRSVEKKGLGDDWNLSSISTLPETWCASWVLHV